jgi:hypothetical protein
VRAPAAVPALLLLAACAGAPAEITRRWPFDATPLMELGVEDFPGAGKVLSGFAPPDDDPAMRVGDAALLGLEITNGDTVDRVLLLLEVSSLLLDAAVKEDTGEPTRPSFTATQTFRMWNPSTKSLSEPETEKVDVHPVQVELTRFDAAGQSQQLSRVLLFEEPLATGLWPDADSTASRRDQTLCATLTRTVQGLVNDDAVLQDLLFCVVDKPSLWSIVKFGGVGVVLIFLSRTEPEPVELAGATTSSRRVALEVNINAEPGLWVDLAVSKPNGATMVCGGLIGAIARHPNDPRRSAVVRLLGTRRGPRVSG